MFTYHFEDGISVSVSDDSGSFKWVYGRWKWFEYIPLKEMKPLRPIYMQDAKTVPFNALRSYCIERGWQ